MVHTHTGVSNTVAGSGAVGSLCLSKVAVRAGLADDLPFLVLVLCYRAQLARHLAQEGRERAHRTRQTLCLAREWLVVAKGAGGRGGVGQGGGGVQLLLRKGLESARSTAN